MATLATSETAPPRSSFVNGIAWLTIISGALGVLGGLLQLLVYVFFLRPMTGRLAQDALNNNTPALPSFILNNWGTIAMVVTLLSVFSLAVGIALLRRREWARQATVYLLYIAALWNGVGAVFGVIAALSPSALVGAPFPPDSSGAMQAMLWVNVVLALLFGAGFVWLARRMASPPVRAEFPLG